MEYVPFGKTGINVSRLGLGCMRFPKEEDEAIRMVRYAVDNGVNYLDTAYMYRDSEVITGKALKDGYRKKVILATKSPIMKITSAAELEPCLDEELKRLGTDYIDVYLLHNMSDSHWEKVKKFDGLDFLDRMIQKGKIRRKAFSIHNTTEKFKEIVNTFDWDMAQIQLNILDENNQVGVEGLKYGVAKGLAMVIMEGLRGGNLTANVPEEITTLINAFPVKRNFAEWCVRWLYNMKEATVILSGTSTLDQLKDNLRIFEHSSPGVMPPEEYELIREMQRILTSKVSIGCTGCRYCMPCPQNVAIPEIFSLYNKFKLIPGNWVDQMTYIESFLSGGKGADKCISCGECEKKCPQNLSIPKLLTGVHEELKQMPVFGPPPKGE
jgi:predicted aldo/keto reductase-like oxidoreductase